MGVTGLLKLTADILLLSAPLIIMLIIRFAEHQWSRNVFPRNDTAVEMSSISPNDTSSWQYVTTTEFWGNGYLLCLVLFVILMLHSCAAHAHDSLVIRHGLRIKAALQVKLYRTCLIKQETFTKFLFDAGPASQTVKQQIHCSKRNFCLMLGQHCRRWAKIKPILSVHN